MLSEIAVIVEQHKNTTLKIAVHTDTIESELDCEEQSKAQANAIKKYLVEKCNIAKEKILSTGMGSKEPLYDNDSAEGRAGNRRIECILIY